MDANEFTVNQKIFDVIQDRSRLRIPRDVMINMEYDIDFNAHILEVSRAMVAEKLAENHYKGSEVVYFYEPLSTWQMFKRTHKDSWWLGWLVRRRPVEEIQHSKWVHIEIAVDRYLKYPDCEIAIPTMGKPVLHEIVRRVK